MKGPSRREAKSKEQSGAPKLQPLDASLSVPFSGSEEIGGAQQGCVPELWGFSTVTVFFWLPVRYVMVVHHLPTPHWTLKLSSAHIPSMTWHSICYLQSECIMS